MIRRRFCRLWMATSRSWLGSVCFHYYWKKKIMIEVCAVGAAGKTFSREFRSAYARLGSNGELFVVSRDSHAVLAAFARGGWLNWEAR